MFGVADMPSDGDKDFEEFFGFTENEVQALIKGTSLSPNELKEWCNSYRIGTTDLYNPFSLTNAIKDKKVGDYWTKTSKFIFASR